MNKENQKKYDAFCKKLLEQEIYFLNDWEDAAIKSTPGKNGGFWIKFKGQPAFAAEKDNPVVNDGILQYTEITKEKFETF